MKKYEKNGDETSTRRPSARVKMNLVRFVFSLTTRKRVLNQNYMKNAKQHILVLMGVSKKDFIQF